MSRPDASRTPLTHPVAASRRRVLTSAAAWTAAASLPWQPAWAADQGYVGVAMPTITSQRWVVEGLAMVRALDRLNYRPELVYADNSATNQATQLEQMLAKGARALIVGAVDGTKLAPVLKKAAAAKVRVLAYDRLIRDSDDVDYYATFDNFHVGVLQGRDIVTRLGLEQSKSEGVPYAIELFGGSGDDNNAFFFYDGALSVLQPYIQKGALVVGSGQMGMNQVATAGWNGSVARVRLVKLLERHYAKQRLHAVLSPYDGISQELIAGLRKFGYGQSGTPLPVITGQDAELPAVRSIIRGDQSSTVFKDTRDLAVVAARMVDAVLRGEPLQINDTKTYHNGRKVVPAYLLQPVLVDASNWREKLVKTGYYRSDMFR